MLTSSKFADIIPRSWDCWQPSTDGLPGASMMLNLTLADLSLKETFKMVAPIFSISEPLYPLKRLLHVRMVIGKGGVLEVCGSDYAGIRSGVDFSSS